jgi:hypothetical protein
MSVEKFGGFCVSGVGVSRKNTQLVVGLLRGMKYPNRAGRQNYKFEWNLKFPSAVFW